MGRNPKFLDVQEWSLALTMDAAGHTPAKISYVLNQDRDVLRLEGKDFDDHRLVREWIRNRINEIHAGTLDAKYVGCHKKNLPRKPLLPVSQTCHEIGHQVEPRRTEPQTPATEAAE